MRAALRDIDHVPLFSRKDNRDVVLKRRRLRAEINDDIEYRALRATYQLCLRIGSCLIVHAAQGSLSSAERNTTLDELDVQSMSLELTHTPSARKESALVWSGFEPNLENSWNLGFSEYHTGSRSSEGTAPQQVFYLASKSEI